MKLKFATGNALLIVAVFLVSLMPMLVSPAKATLPDYEPMRLGPEFRDSHLPINGFPEDFGTGNPTKVWLVSDSFLGYYFFDMFELMATGEVLEIWVQLDLSWEAGDPRAYPIITQDQVDYLLAEFENNIYPTDLEYFGVPDFHDGTYSLLEAWGYVPPGYYFEETGRIAMLVSNIRDENYYDYTYPYYVAGFYSSTLEAYFDRNVISIDAYDWENRIGPDVDKPFTYEATITHEFQHLIHADYVPGDEAFMNEGCSMYAEVLCGYGIPWGDINSYLHTPDNSLTVWGDQGGINILADYGVAALWTIYLSDQYGGSDFISYYMQAGIPGIGGINEVLNYFGYKETFDDVYRNWRIANLIHSDNPGGGRYNYKSLELGNEEAEPARTYQISGLPVDPTKGTDFGNTLTILGYDTGISMIGPYGSDYILLNDWEKLGILNFDGDDFMTVPPQWTWTGTEWYSGTGDEVDALIAASAYVNPSNAELELTTYWDIEDYWDFGFVQVSTDGGVTWTSLENEYTTYDHDPAAMSSIVSNLPGLTGWSVSDITMTFDLTPYTGNEILIGLRYMTDWATTYEGWYISNVKVSAVDITTDFAPILPEADFIVTAIKAFVGDGITTYVPFDMTLNDGAETGSTLGFKQPAYTIIIVSPISEKGFVDYEFQAQKFVPRKR